MMNCSKSQSIYSAAGCQPRYATKLQTHSMLSRFMELQCGRVCIPISLVNEALLAASVWSPRPVHDDCLHGTQDGQSGRCLCCTIRSSGPSPAFTSLQSKYSFEPMASCSILMTKCTAFCIVTAVRGAGIPENVQL